MRPNALLRFALIALAAAAAPQVATRAVEAAPGGAQHWAFAPIARPDPPAVNDVAWPRGAIDRFILHRLEAAELAPTADADRAVLLRRVTFDLTGLPPSPAELEAFLGDDDPQSYARVVDRLLLSRRFGERWGRHWLDVVRFAESSGGGRSLMFPQAWRYRDYVIDALNDDMPFDQFIVEQLAGDLLPEDDPALRDRRAVATGMLVLGATNFELQDKELLEVEIADDQIDTVGRAFLAMTLGCARCHDHKFDPISTEEYYGLAGIFLSTKSVQHANVGKYMERPLTDGPEAAAFQEHQQQLEAARTKLAAARKRVRALAKADSQDQLAAIEQSVDELESRMKELQASAPPKPIAMAVVDEAEPGDVPLLYGGVVRAYGPVAPRCVLSAAAPDSDATIATDGSGRLELARWIASPENPLTARVIANRAWARLFGAGLVRTVDNFGARGEQPSHPELLDWLAQSLVEDGWSLKSLIRRIVLSRTYRLASSSAADAEVEAVDPENRLLSRANRRRLDAEAIRDAVLSVSGRLDLTSGGPTIRKLAKYDHNYRFDSVRRSVYVPRFRGAQLELFTAFDVANPNMVCGRRAVSVLPTQALYMMNHEFLIRSSEAAAQRLLGDVHDEQARLDLISRRALSRLPTDAERQVYREYLQTMRGPSDDDPLAVWSGLCQLIFASVDFRYVN